MPHFLQPLIAVPLIPDYKYNIASVEEDDVCYICREPFSIDDCLPLQITACGHIVGDKCLFEWMKRQPGLCPYWNHLLPHRPAHESSMIRTVVGSRVGSVWFHVFERYILDLPCLSIRKEIQCVISHPDWYINGSVQNSHIILLAMRNVVATWNIGLVVLLFRRLTRDKQFGRDPVSLVGKILVLAITLVNILTLPTLVAIIVDWFKRRSRARAASTRLRRW